MSSNYLLYMGELSYSYFLFIRRDAINTFKIKLNIFFINSQKIILIILKLKDALCVPDVLGSGLYNYYKFTITASINCTLYTIAYKAVSVI